MSLKPKARLYYSDSLSKQNEITLPKEDSHYLCTVLRIKINSEVLLFNEREGEWLALLKEPHKKAAQLQLIKQIRVAATSTLPLTLVFAPLKKDRMDFLIEKAVELGVTEFRPILTEHSDVQKCNFERLKLQIKEASEQCERLDMPIIHPMRKLSDMIGSWPKKTTLYFCQEKGKASPALDVMNAEKNGEAGFLIGPAGGFSLTEIQTLQNQPFVKPLHLGPRILRAETASLACITLYQALKGDWQETPNTYLKEEI